MGDRDADLADFALRQRMVGVVAGLGRQVEGDGKAGLALGEVFAVEGVRVAGGRMPRIGAENPRLVAHAPILAGQSGAIMRRVLLRRNRALRLRGLRVWKSAERCLGCSAIA